MLTLDDANRYLETCPPKEIILYTNITENDKISNLLIEESSNLNYHPYEV